MSKKLIIVFAVFIIANLQSCISHKPKSKNEKPNDICNKDPVSSVSSKNIIDVTWESNDFPLEVSIHESVNKRIRKATAKAVEQWNEAVGKQVFFLTTGTKKEKYGSITIVETDDLGENDCGQELIGMAYRNYRTDILGRNKSLLSVKLVIKKNVRGSKLKNVMVHELGHALGLEHDDNRASIMYPTVDKNRDSRILEVDAREIRELME